MVRLPRLSVRSLSLHLSNVEDSKEVFEDDEEEKAPATIARGMLFVNSYDLTEEAATPTLDCTDAVHVW
jgi:hypothetical protein